MDTKLYIKDDEYIVIPLKRPTMQVKDELLKLNLSFANEQKKIMQNEKFKDIEEIQNLLLAYEKDNDTTQMLAIMNNPDKAVLIQEYTMATQKLADEYSLKKFKEVINTKSIDDLEIKKQIESAVSSAFWKNQDMEEVSNALDFFRKKLGIG